jgi:hypothetical protein
VAWCEVARGGVRWQGGGGRRGEPALVDTDAGCGGQVGGVLEGGWLGEGVYGGVGVARCIEALVADWKGEGQGRF